MKKNVLKKEEVFHDTWATSINVASVMVDEFFEACTSPENKIILKKLGDVKNKKILEIGCGAGEASVYFAKKGADVIATDISGKMLQVVKKVAKYHKTELRVKKCYSDKMPFNDSVFDIVYAANLLHHVEIESTIREVFRVLKKGGVFVSWDPLAHNIIINIYRSKATSVRTKNEHPIKMKDLNIFRKYFPKIEVKTTWLFSLWIFLRFYLIEGVDPNKERYWKKILVEHSRLKNAYLRLEKIDKMFLKLFPFMRRYCWNIVILCTK